MKKFISRNKSDTENNAAKSVAISASEYAARENAASDQMRSELSSDWLINSFVLNPMRIIEESRKNPINAAYMCSNACLILQQGHHKRVHEYLVAAYSVACEMRGKQECFEQLAMWISDARSSRGIKPEKIEENLLHYVFIFVFQNSGLTSRNRATQYAISLQDFFDEDASLKEVSQMLKKYGQEKLYRAVEKKRSLIKGARLLEAEGKNPAKASLEKILRSMASIKHSSVPLDDDAALESIGSREIMPDDRDSDEIEADNNYFNLTDDLVSDNTENHKKAIDAATAESQSIGKTQAKRSSESAITTALIYSLADKALRLGVALANDNLNSDDRKQAIHISIELAKEICELKDFIGIQRN